MNKENLTLLSSKQVWGNKSNIFSKCGTGTSCIVTDLCILTGCECYFGIYEDALYGYYWTKTPAALGTKVTIANNCGKKCTSPLKEHSVAIRPVLNSSKIFSQINSDNKVEVYDGVFGFEYGEYPQYVADKKMQKILNLLFEYEELDKTGKEYTFNIINDFGLLPTAHEEYEFKGEKYIRVEIHSRVILSNNIDYKNGDYVWIKVAPVNWLIDDKEKILISEFGLVSGIRFNNPRRIYTGNFEKTEIKKYLDEHMAKDLFQDLTLNPKNHSECEEEIELEEKQNNSENSNEKTTYKNSNKEKKKQLEKLKQTLISQDTLSSELEIQKAEQMTLGNLKKYRF